MDEQTTVRTARRALEDWQATRPRNLYTTDRLLQRVLSRYLGDALDAHTRDLEATGAASSSPLAELVDREGRDENLPRLEPFDGIGRHAEEVVFHPLHDEIGRYFWGSGALSVLAEPGNERLSGALIYLLDQNGEAGHACPIACTAGAAKLIQAVGTAEQKERWLPSLLERDYDRRLHAAQFVTEVQGGSDVGSNELRAVAEPDASGAWRLWGEKWFCSVADAGLFVVTARPDEAAGGTRGLALFLVPRTVDGEPNGFRLRRLKTKLGTRSLATGEIDFEGARAELIGPLDHGFKNLLAIVLDTSRVHNALASTAFMRRAYTEAQSYARHRIAFGRRIVDYPAVQATLARMRLRLTTSVLTTFRILDMTDRLAVDPGDDALRRARRIAVMINKYWTAVGATAAARDGIEILGGNGTIEDFSPLPRLYRDAMVLESWEGSHNTLAAQVIRDMAVRGLAAPWFESLHGELAAVRRPELADGARAAHRFLETLRGRADRLLAEGENRAAALMRPLLDQMCLATDLVALLTQAAWELDRGLDADTGKLIELYRLQEIDRADPLGQPRLPALWGEISKTV